MGLGFLEIAVIFLVALIVVGPNKLPELARAIGRGLNQFRKGMQDLERAVQETVSLDDATPPNPSACNTPPRETGESGTHPENQR